MKLHTKEFGCNYSFDCFASKFNISLFAVNTLANVLLIKFWKQTGYFHEVLNFHNEILIFYTYRAIIRSDNYQLSLPAGSIIVLTAHTSRTAAEENDKE
jgi:hypothetical protein